MGFPRDFFSFSFYKRLTLVSFEYDDLAKHFKNNKTEATVCKSSVMDHYAQQSLAEHGVTHTVVKSTRYVNFATDSRRYKAPIQTPCI